MADPARPQAAVSATDLTVGHESQAVVRDIAFVVERGHTLALCGGNGSGKSTLLKTIAGLLDPLAGSVAVLGAPPGRRARQVAYVSQHHDTNDTLPLRAEDVVRMARYPQRGLFRRLTSADRQVIAEAMRRVGIEHLADHAIRDMSRGQRQRVHLAQALAREADLYLLDEPTTGLDAVGHALYRRICDEERARGAAIVVATHDFAEAHTADDVMLLSQRVVAHGPPDTTFTKDNLLETFGVSLTEVADDGPVAIESHHHHHQHGQGT